MGLSTDHPLFVDISHVPVVILVGDLPPMRAPLLMCGVAKKVLHLFLNLQGSSNVNEITKRFNFNLKYVMPLLLFYHCFSVFRDTTSFGWELTFFPISVVLKSHHYHS